MKLTRKFQLENNYDNISCEKEYTTSNSTGSLMDLMKHYDLILEDEKPDQTKEITYEIHEKVINI